MIARELQRIPGRTRPKSMCDDHEFYTERGCCYDCGNDDAILCRHCELEGLDATEIYDLAMKAGYFERHEPMN